jgi:phosphate transport system permease protein
VRALVLILCDLVVKGWSSLYCNFFVKNPVAAGQTGGGVANAIVGTAIIVGLAALIGLPIGIGTGLYLAEYGSGRLGWFIRFVADVMNGTPSIVVGIFAWTWLVKPMHHFSALAGSVALAALLLPMLAPQSAASRTPCAKPPWPSATRAGGPRCASSSARRSRESSPVASSASRASRERPPRSCSRPSAT